MKYLKLFGLHDFDKILEFKNYGDLYHSIFRSEKPIDVVCSILQNGIKFTETYLPRANGRWKFIKDNIYRFSVCVSRIEPKSKIYFVLDGKEISNKYKIEPFNLISGLQYDFPEPMGNWRQIKSRHMSEEKILSKKSGYLSPKYIKKIVLVDINQEDLDRIKKSNIHQIEIIVK